ncbi:MAG TPA: TraR/DksA family transcriptional regulator [Steroidobacteraceae bacterium]|nr:TraR/DksA family transcriptional regulator [Steroidobacteraceae bacterium]
MSELDSDKLAELRNVLEERAQALRNELRETVSRSDQEKSQLLRDGVRDNGDDSFVDLVTDVNLAEVDRDLSEFRLVRAALERMNSGEYGRCESCGREISLKRLQAQPFATRCLQCQEQYEHLTNQPRTPTL